jgi:hypothetical protein
MVGNGVTNWTYDTETAFIDMAYWHSLYSQETHDAMVANKCDYTGIPLGRNATQPCMDLFDKFSVDVEDINVYNIFGECYGLPGKNGKKVGSAHERGLVKVGNELKSYKKYYTAADYTPWLKNRIGELPPCVYGDPLLAYLNSAEVRSALHIPEQYPAWDMCNSDTFDYTILERGSQWIYEALKG